MNLLQQTLLERWLGDRDELCVVGDDYQSIYSFTGATPEYLLRARGQVFRLEENYRSTPEILELANRLVPKLGGAEKVLRATRPAGEAPVLRACEDAEAEVASIVGNIETFHREGVPYEEMAVLYRINSRSEDFEEALSEAGIPYQVRGGAFLAQAGGARDAAGAAGLERPAGRNRRGGRASAGPGGRSCRTASARRSRRARATSRASSGWRRSSARARWRSSWPISRAASARRRQGRGVNLLTYHRAKGLEFEVVFLPRLEEGELPFKRAKLGEALAEERRLLYVGMTRAKRYLEITWSGEPSRFLAELGVEEPERVAADDPVVKALKAWRLERARKDEVPAFVVFHDSTLEEIARQNRASCGSSRRSRASAQRSSSATATRC